MSTTQCFPSYGGIGVHASPSWSHKCLVCTQFHNNSGSRGGTPSIEDASAVERGASRRDHAAPSLSSAAGPVSSAAGAPGAARPRPAHPQSGPPAGSSFFGPMSLPAGVQARQKADMKVPACRTLSFGTCSCIVFVVAATSQEHMVLPYVRSGLDQGRAGCWAFAFIPDTLVSRHKLHRSTGYPLIRDRMQWLG